MKVINMFGGPSSGKSTIAAGLFYFMKLRGYNVELVTEYAKDLVYSDRLALLDDQQEYIFTKQNYRMHRLRDKVDWIVTDSPLLLSCVYVNDDWPSAKTFRQLVIETFGRYDNINIFLNRPSIFQREGRVHNLEQSMKIDDKIKFWLSKINAHYTTIDATDHACEDIMNLIG